MPQGCLLWFLSGILSVFLYFCCIFSTLFVKNSLAVMTVWWNDILNFQGLYIAAHTSFKLTKHSPYLLSTDFSKL